MLFETIIHVFFMQDMNIVFIATNFRIEEWMCISDTLEVVEIRFWFICVRVNHFDVHLMILSRDKDSKVLRMKIQLKCFHVKKEKWEMSF